MLSLQDTPKIDMHEMYLYVYVWYTSTVYTLVKFFMYKHYDRINNSSLLTNIHLHHIYRCADIKKQGKSEGFESCDRLTVQKCPIWVKIGDVLYRVTLKFDGWLWKTIGHLSFAVSSFVQHFIAIGEFKLELQSGNARFGSNLTIFRAVWPWNLTYDLEKQWGTSSILLQALCIILYPLVNSNLSYSPETLNSGQNRRFF